MRLSPSATAAGSHPTDDGKIHRCAGCAGGCVGRAAAAALLPRMEIGERSEAPPQQEPAAAKFLGAQHSNNKIVN